MKKTLYGLTKTIGNERHRQNTAVLDKNGNLVNGEEEVQLRWTEHVKEVLDRKESTSSITVDNESEFNEMIADISPLNLHKAKAK